jgi:hypothetical protein
MKGIVDVDAGICGFNAHIEAESPDAFGPCTVSLDGMDYSFMISLPSSK